MVVAAYKEYRRTQVAASSQRDLILMMYAAAIRNAKDGKEAILAGKTQEANGALLKAQDIIFELMGSLRLDVGEIATNLYSLYEYIISQLAQANIHKDTERIDQVVDMLTELREAWEQIAQPVESNDQTHARIALRG